MPVAKVMYKDRDGFHYKHPERSCTSCKNYPCIQGMQEMLLGDFGKYGCRNYSNINVFDLWKPKR